MKISLRAKNQDHHRTILDEDAIIEIEDAAGRLVISFSEGNVEIADDEFEGSVIHKRVSL